MTAPLHIGLLLQGGRGWLGGFEYIKSLLLSLASLPPEDRAKFRVSLLTNGPLDEADRQQIADTVCKVISVKSPLPPRTLTQRLESRLRRKVLRQEYSHFDELLKHHQIDFVYPYVSDDDQPKSYSYAAWIPDFQHKYLPEFFSASEIQARDDQFERMARIAPFVILSSRSAQQDFKKFFPFAAEKSRVLSFHTPHSEKWFHETPMKVLQEYNIPPKFCFVANQFWKHKNHLLVFEALKRLSDEGVHIPTVLTGNLHDYRFPEYSDTVLQTVHRLGINKQVLLLGVVPRAHYIQLLRACAVVIQASLFEGWSTIIEDARAIGKPVIVSDLDVHLEQKPPRAVYFKRSSVEDLVVHLREEWIRLLHGPSLEQEEMAKQDNVRQLQMAGQRMLEIAQEARAQSVSKK